MFIEFKNLRKKRYIALLITVLFFISCTYKLIYNDFSLKRVETVLYHDEAFLKEFGDVKKYNIERVSNGVITEFGEAPFVYNVSVIGEKKEGGVEIFIWEYGDSPRYSYTNNVKKSKRKTPKFLYRSRSVL